MIRAVLFDLDGTLVDCIRPMERAFVEVVEELGAKITDEDRANVAENLRSLLIQRSSPYAGVVFLWRLGRYVGLPRHKNLLMIFKAFRRLKRITEDSPLFPGTIELLTQLRGMSLKLGIVTTRSANEALPLLKRLSVAHFFDAVVTRDDAARSKPYPDPVQLALKLLSAAPEEAVMIGDMPTDIDSGRGAGTKTVGLLVGIFNKELVAAKPDALAGSLQEITPALSRL